MNGFGRAVAHGVGALLVTLSIGNAFASEFSDKAARVFSSIDSVSEEGATGRVSLKVPDRTPSYFETGDKANKIFAIDTIRVFRDVPKVDRMIVTVPRADRVQTLDVTRAQVEQYYEVKLSDLAASPSNWRERFIDPYDNKKSRAGFVERFVTEK